MAELNCPLREASDISPHEKALIAGEAEFLFPELDQLVSIVARRLKDLGLEPGDRVGIFRPQDEYYVILLLAGFRLGLVLCPLNTRWPRAMVARALHQIKAKAVIAQGKDSHVEGIRRIDPEPLFQPGGDPLAWSGKMAIERPATIIFSSGSMGRPKAALLSYGNHYYSARGSNANLRIHSRDKWLLSLPLFHVGGLGIVFRCLLGGGIMALPEPGEELGLSIKRTGATHVSVVATQLQRLLADPDFKGGTTSLKVILLGGGPVPETLVREARRRGLPVYPSYGLTEMASQVTAVKPDAPPARHGSSGSALRHREIRVSADGGIFVRGSTLFLGYLEDGVLVPPTVDDGWFATGDLGTMSDDGYLTVTGRRDNLFISGGENVQPEEIERVMAELPGIDQVVVVPVPDEEFGHRPVALIRGLAAEGGLAEALRAHLPGYMVPIAYLAWPEEPTGHEQKPDRKHFARHAAAQLGR